jgi:uncharacterized membrane protein
MYNQISPFAKDRAMSGQLITLVLRFFHVGAGIFWAGAIFVMARFLMPAMRESGPEGGRFMARLAPKFTPAMLGAAVVTLLSGFALYGRNEAASGGAWSGTNPGITYGIGALCALLAFIIGVSVSSPTGRKLAKLVQSIQAAGGPPSPEQAAEMQRLQGRLGTAGGAVAALVGITVITMALARYM